MSGNGSSMAGILVEGGTFDWMQNDKFPSMTEPYEGYHGLSFAEEFGPTAFTMMARAEGMSCLLYTSPSPRDLSTSRMPSSA